MSRIELSSVPEIAFCHAASSSSANVPGGGPPLLTRSPSSPPRRLDRSPDRGRWAFRLRQVDGYGVGAEPLGGGGQLIRRPGRERESSAIGRKSPRDRRPEPAAATGDKEAPISQAKVHGPNA